MARPGLRNNPKFLRLVQMLKMPPPHVYGHLEFLWSVAYENGNPVIGDEMSVELSSGWAGETGALCRALLACGGPGRDGFIEEVTRVTEVTHTALPALPCVTYQIHDLFDHAPGYVRDRAAKEGSRRPERECEWCGDAFHSSEPHAKFCSNSCRQQEFKNRKRLRGNAGNAEVTHKGNAEVTQVTQGNGPPAPAPAPVLREEKGNGKKFGRSPTSLADPDSEDPVKRLDGWEFSGLGPTTSRADVKTPLAEWVLDQREKGRTVTATGMREQIGRLEKMGAARAIAAIKFSLANGYTGIVEEKEGKNGKQEIIPPRPRITKTVNFEEGS